MTLSETTSTTTTTTTAAAKEKTSTSDSQPMPFLMNLQPTEKFKETAHVEEGDEEEETPEAAGVSGDETTDPEEEEVEVESDGQSKKRKRNVSFDKDANPEAKKKKEKKMSKKHKKHKKHKTKQLSGVEITVEEAEEVTADEYEEEVTVEKKGRVEITVEEAEEVTVEEEGQVEIAKEKKKETAKEKKGSKRKSSGVAPKKLVPTKTRTAVGANAIPTLKVRRPHRFRPGTVALREIRKYQKSTDFLIRKRPFQRLVREIAQDYKHEARFTLSALIALQESAEAFLTGVFERANEQALHAKRITVDGRDIAMVLLDLNRSCKFKTSFSISHNNLFGNRK